MTTQQTAFGFLKKCYLSLKQAASPWKDKPLSDIRKRRALKYLTAPHNSAQLAQQRKDAGVLIEAVLDGILSPTQALIKWPVKIHSHDSKHTTYLDINDDPSLQAAYQILWHFEADETQQRHEVFYLDAQLALLGQVADSLSKGQDLPMYLLELYTTEHEAHFYSGFSFRQSVGALINRPVQSIAGLFRQVLTYKKRPL